MNYHHKIIFCFCTLLCSLSLSLKIRKLVKSLNLCNLSQRESQFCVDYTRNSFGFYLMVIVNEKHINLEKTKSSVLSVILINLWQWWTSELPERRAYTKIWRFAPRILWAGQPGPGYEVYYRLCRSKMHYIHVPLKTLVHLKYRTIVQFFLQIILEFSSIMCVFLSLKRRDNPIW